MQIQKLGFGIRGILKLLSWSSDVHISIGILGQVWYLIVSIPDLCTLTYFVLPYCQNELYSYLKYHPNIWMYG